MTAVWIYSMASVLIVSMISLVGIITISIRQGLLQKIVLFLVSFSAGVLLGDTFIHLLPEAMRRSDGQLTVPLSVLTGIVVFFILEKIISWRHCHVVTSKQHPHPVAYMNLIGDGFHNFMDGMIIAGSFLASPQIGIATTIAVITHEIPQEMGDFGVLIYAGMNRTKALMFNFLSATAAFLGAAVVLVLSLKTGQVTTILVPFTAGGFIYIAGSDLIPELKEHISTLTSVLELACLLLGMLVMLALSFWG